MVPSGAATAQTIKDLGELLSEGDLVIDGGNSKYTDDARHAEMLDAKGISFVDAGVSGGVWGLKNGYADGRRRHRGCRPGAADLRRAQA